MNFKKKTIKKLGISAKSVFPVSPVLALKFVLPAKFVLLAQAGIQTPEQADNPLSSYPLQAGVQPFKNKKCFKKEGERINITNRKERLK